MVVPSITKFQKTPATPDVSAARRAQSSQGLVSQAKQVEQIAQSTIQKATSHSLSINEIRDAQDALSKMINLNSELVKSGHQPILNKTITKMTHLIDTQLGKKMVRTLESIIANPIKLPGDFSRLINRAHSLNNDLIERHGDYSLQETLASAERLVRSQSSLQNS